jgi:hypothetical protein
VVKIELFYVPGCPHYEPALERVRKALAAEAVEGEIHRVLVTTVGEANALLFPGSPTIRINGKDVEPSSTLSPGLACRIYGNRSGIPAEETLRAAISKAKQKE